MGDLLDSVLGVLTSPARLARYLLLSPVMLILFGWICSLIPPLGRFVNDFFVNVLGEFGAFRIPITLFSAVKGMSGITVETYFAQFKEMLWRSVYDSLIPGGCVMVLKSFNSFAQEIKGKISVKYTVPEWILTVLGIAIGLVIIKVTGLTGSVIKLIMGVLLIWAIIVAGINIMGRQKGMRGLALRKNYVVILLQYALSVLTAQCAFFMISVIMTAYEWTHSGYGKLWFWWSMLSVGVVLLAEGVVIAVNKVLKQYK